MLSTSRGLTMSKEYDIMKNNISDVAIGKVFCSDKRDKHVITNVVQLKMLKNICKYLI